MHLLPNIPIKLALILGRWMLALMFVESATSHILHYSSVLAEAKSHGLPFAQLLFPISIGIEMLGILSLISGRYLHPGCLVLAGFVLSSTFIFFPFWALEGHAAAIAQQNFVKNLAVFAMLVIIYASVDRRNQATNGVDAG